VHFSFSLIPLSHRIVGYARHDWVGIYQNPHPKFKIGARPRELAIKVQIRDKFRLALSVKVFSIFILELICPIPVLFQLPNNMISNSPFPIYVAPLCPVFQVLFPEISSSFGYVPKLQVSSFSIIYFLPDSEGNIRAAQSHSISRGNPHHCRIIGNQNVQVMVSVMVFESIPFHLMMGSWNFTFLGATTIFRKHCR